MENNKDFLREALESDGQSAKSRLEAVMPKGNDTFKATDFEMRTEYSQSEIREKTKGYTEVPAGKNKDKVAEAQSQLGKTPNNGSAYQMDGADGYKYKVLYINGEWKVYKGEKAETSQADAVDSKVAEQFSGAYKKLDNPAGRDKQALKHARSQIGRDDIYTVEDGDNVYVLTKSGKFYKGK